MPYPDYGRPQSLLMNYSIIHCYGALMEHINQIEYFYLNAPPGTFFLGSVLSLVLTSSLFISIPFSLRLPQVLCVGKRDSVCWSLNLPHGTLEF